MPNGNLVDCDPLSGVDSFSRTENALRDTSLPSDNSAGACAPNRRLGADWVVAGRAVAFLRDRHRRRLANDQD
jgi:hypothetical protein